MTIMTTMKMRWTHELIVNYIFIYERVMFRAAISGHQLQRL